MAEVEHGLAVDAARRVRAWRLAITLISYSLAGHAAVIGTLLALGPESRFSSPAFAAIVETPPAGIATWSVIWFVVAGGILLGALLRDNPAVHARADLAAGIRILAHGAAGFVAGAFGFSFLLAAVDDPRASLLAIPTYLLIGVIHVLFALTVYDDRLRR